MLKSICTRCGKLMQYGQACPCRAIYKRERDRQYDTQQRNKDTAAIYHSKEWQSVRAVVIARDNGLCLVCLSNNRITTADTVHHIVEIKEDARLVYDTDNLVSVCSRCHGKVHRAYKVGREAEQSRLRDMVGGSKLF